MNLPEGQFLTKGSPASSFTGHVLRG